MSRNSSGVLAKINVPLALLWLAGLVVTAVGYLVMTSSNATQAKFAASGSQDYATYFTAQSGSTLGNILIGAGVLGMLLALATQVMTRPAAIPAVLPATESAEGFFADDDDELDLTDDDVVADENAAESVDADQTPEKSAPLSEPKSEPKSESKLEPTTTR